MPRSRLALIAADLDAAIGGHEAPAVARLAIRAALAAHPAPEKSPTQCNSSRPGSEVGA
jgi:hypothetical protein